MSATSRPLQATLLAAVVNGSARPAEVFSSVPEAFFDPPLRFLADAILTLRLARAPITPTSVESQMRQAGTLAPFGGAAELTTLLMATATDPDSVAYALAIVAHEYEVEESHRFLVRAAQHLENSGPETDLDKVGEALIARGERIITRSQALSGDVHVPTLDEFLTAEDEPYDWVIPDLLEHGDRMILTGVEGVGKSTVLRQVGVCAAAGVHPFEHYRIPQKRVLIVDCENYPVPTRRNLRPLRHEAARLGSDPGQWLHVETIPAGLELDRPTDSTRLLSMVTSVMPDILIVGPIYRLYGRDGNDEETGRAVSRTLDHCRAVSNCAVLTEAHMPNESGGSTRRDIRPIGTSLWRRWPEFGYGITTGKDYDPSDRRVRMTPWRGDRDVRNWPSRLASTGTGLPWRTDWTPEGAESDVEPDRRYGD